MFYLKTRRLGDQQPETVVAIRTNFLSRIATPGLNAVRAICSASKIGSTDARNGQSDSGL
jgi:hypothetical protein